MLRKFLPQLMILLCCGLLSQAHPMPNSLVRIKVQTNRVDAELKLPLTELQIAFGKPLSQHPGQIIDDYGNALKTYLLEHVKPTTPEGQNWSVAVDSLNIDSAEQTLTGKYYELNVFMRLIPPPQASTRHFLLTYDVIIHQLVTHKAIVYVSEDWENGVTGQNRPTGESENTIGIISLDTRNNIVHPLVVQLKQGSLWKGWANMFWLGADHIAEGADHLLFLLVLLPAAPLLVVKNKWSGAGEKRYTLIRIIRMVTAFTIGHSLTLLLGALGILHLPGRPVEVLIAFSILITAIHCLKPLFYGKEMLVAAGFGLVHGLAFATVLANLHLPAGQMALSLLGFNLGIEAVQLTMVLAVFPLLLWVRHKPIYGYIRKIGAIAALVVSAGWIIERLSSF
jgi:hypothetical protein